jgi:hypothetical protein
MSTTYYIQCNIAGSVMLKEIKLPMKFFIKAYKSCDFKNLDKSLAAAFEAMRDVTDADIIGLTLSRERGRKTPITMNNFDKIGKFMHTNNAENIENFKITYKDLKNEETVTIDLLDMFLYDTAKVSQIDAVHKSVDTKSMYKALEASIKKNLAVLQDIQ